MIRKFFILSYFFPLYILLSSTSAAQENIAQKSPYIEEDQISDDESPHSFFAGAGYGNNMIYMGSNVSQNKPFISGSVTYGFKNRFFASVSTSHLSAFDPFISFSAFSLSYYQDVNSWFDISAGLSRYQVQSDLRDTLFSSFFYGYITLGFDWNILYTTISAGGLFSELNSAYFNLRNSRYFTTPEFFNGKAFVSFDPYVNMLFGTLTKTISSDGTTIGVSTPFKPGKPSGGSGSGTGTTINFFSLMEVDLGLPVGFNIGKLTMEAEPGYVFPAYSVYSIESPKGFVLLFNIFYRIF